VTGAAVGDGKLLLGVDGGDTKTVALVTSRDGLVVGTARGAGSDIYDYPDPADAIAVLADVITRALAQAGADVREVANAVFCLAGADWPEDLELLQTSLDALLPDASVEVHHDSQGHVWAGHPDGVGIGVAFGTALAMGSRNADGREWSSTNWVELNGSLGLGHHAMRAVLDARLGVSAETLLSQTMPLVFGVGDVDEMAHLLTNRAHLGRHHAKLSHVGPLVLDAAAAGDEVARGIVDRQLARLAEYVAAAGRIVDLPRPWHVSLGGGPTRHESNAIFDGLQRAVDESTTVTLCRREAVVGSVLKARHSAGLENDEDTLSRLDATTPDHAFFATLPVRAE
jgi:N-acetylglucosamine kinase-like BadF-type ATPase